MRRLWHDENPKILNEVAWGYVGGITNRSSRTITYEPPQELVLVTSEFRSICLTNLQEFGKLNIALKKNWKNQNPARSLDQSTS